MKERARPIKVDDQAAIRSHHTIVFHGDPDQVGAGFALALDAMEAHANLMMAGGRTSPQDIVAAFPRMARQKKSPGST